MLAGSEEINCMHIYFGLAMYQIGLGWKEWNDFHGLQNLNQNQYADVYSWPVKEV